MTRSEQARADALADAATLRMVVATMRPRNRAVLEIGPAASALVIAVRWNALGAAPDAVSIARAAFRAVPGLRDKAVGEDKVRVVGGE